MNANPWVEPSTPQWNLHSDSHYIAIQFEALARRAGDGFSPNSEDSFQAWIAALWAFNANVDTHREMIGREPHVFVEDRKRIRDVAQTSALLCSHLEITELNGERKSRTQPSETIGKQIERLRLEAQITQEKLAELVRLDIRNVQRHIAGVSTPSDRTIVRYQNVFKQLLGRKILIGETP